MLRHHALISPLCATSYIFHAWVFRDIAAALICRLVYRGARRPALWVAGVLDAAEATSTVLW